MKVEKIPVMEIIFSELTFPQSTTLLKSELLHMYFSKFSTISKEQWSYLKISSIISSTSLGTGLRYLAFFYHQALME